MNDVLICTYLLALLIESICPKLFYFWSDLVAGIFIRGFLMGILHHNSALALLPY